MTTHSGRVALVTGGGRGIGRAISLRLAASGADIAVNFRRNSDTAEATVAEIKALGREAKSYQASVDSWEEDVAMCESVLNDFGKVDILVHNAGILSRGLSITESDPEELTRVVAMHAFGPFYLSKLLVPQMRSLSRADIVFVSSTVTRTIPPNSAPYIMGKGAADSLAHALAREEQRNGIHVNTVAPGLVATDMGDALIKAVTRGKSSRAADLDSNYPFGRVCRPEDVANVVDFLVSPAASYLTSQRIDVDGGGGVSIF